MEPEDRKLDRIRKLLAKAETAGTAEEAKVYNAKATELMARHSIDSAMVAAAEPARDRVGSRRIAMEAPYSREKATLVGCIATTMNCRAVSHPGPGRGRIGSVTLVGFESDLTRVEMAFTSLLLQATRSVVRQEPPGWSYESTTAFRRSWLIGFTAEVHRRLDEAAQRATTDHDAGRASGQPSAELVLADRRTLVDRAVADRFPTLRRQRPRRLSGSEFEAGCSAGRRADIDRKRVGPGRPELGPAGDVT